MSITLYAAIQSLHVSAMGRMAAVAHAMMENVSMDKKCLMEKPINVIVIICYAASHHMSCSCYSCNSAEVASKDTYKRSSKLLQQQGRLN